MKAYTVKENKLSNWSLSKLKPYALQRIHPRNKNAKPQIRRKYVSHIYLHKFLYTDCEKKFKTPGHMESNKAKYLKSQFIKMMKDNQ